MSMRACLLLLVLVCRPLPAADVNQSFGVAVRPFLKTYCFECHGADEQFGERRFDELSGAISDSNSLLVAAA